MRGLRQTLFVLPYLFRISLAQVFISIDAPIVILPLGDSITFGTDSSDGNGYRQDLERLIEANTPIQYIGSVKAGTMADNSNEGHPGFRIEEIAAQAPQNFNSSPNVVLLMAGTNDILQSRNVSTAPDRLSTLIDQLIEGLPSAAILVATLTPLLREDFEAERVTYNEAIPGIVNERAQAGKLVQVVDMSKVTTSGINGTDGIHPNDDGYAIMAQAWYVGIIEAASKGWITVGNLTSGSNATSNSSSLTTATNFITSTSLSASTATGSAAATATPSAVSMAVSMSISTPLCTSASLLVAMKFFYSFFL